MMLLMAFFTVAFTLYTPILIGEGVDTIIGPGNVKTKALLRILGTLAMVVLGTAVTQWIMNLLTNQCNLWSGTGYPQSGIFPFAGGAGFLY